MVSNVKSPSQEGIDNFAFDQTLKDNSEGRRQYGSLEIVGDSRSSENESDEVHWSPKWWPSKTKNKRIPTFRTVARFLSFILIGVVTWYTMYLIFRDTVLPFRGKIFQIGLLTGVSMMAGYLVSLTNLPALIGNLFIGALFQNIGVVDIDASFNDINKFLKGLALIVILIRAGLGLNPTALKQLKWNILSIGLLPWLLESIVVGVMAFLLFDMPWTYGLALGLATSAISPAVTVPSLLRLTSQGYGNDKGIATLIMAITTLTDVLSIVGFGIIQGIIFSTGSLTNLILQLPVSLVGGIGFGLIWGFICSFSPESKDSNVVSLRICLTMAGGILSVFGSTSIGFGGAGPLACVTAPFLSSIYWKRQGWKVGDNPVSASFKFLWAIFEPILFAITGAQIKIYLLDRMVILLGTGILLIGILVRTVFTIILGTRSAFSLKENFFSSMAMAAKATVQAALATVFLDMIHDETSDDYKNANKIMMKMMQYENENETLKDKSACAGVRADLKMCLLQSDCCKLQKRTPRECLRANDGSVPTECQVLRNTFFECKRSLLDARQRFRGRKGY